MSAQETQPALEVTGLRKAFGAVQALDGADLSCRAGEVTALVGDNGAGKSTLIRCITGVHPFDEGAIRFGNQAIKFSYPPKHGRWESKRSIRIWRSWRT